MTRNLPANVCMQGVIKSEQCYSRVWPWSGVVRENYSSRSSNTCL